MTTDNASQEKFMILALEEGAAAYAEGEVPVGCVIVKDGEVVARGRNAVERTGSVLAHAEIRAIEEAEKVLGKFLCGCDMYVTVEPCAMCAGAIVGARISRLFYGTREERTGCCGSLYALTEDRRFFATVETKGGIKEEDCKALIKRFFAERRER